MTVLNLGSLMPLPEDFYTGAILEDIVANFNQDDPGTIKSIDAIFVINERRISDRLFAMGDSRLSEFLDSIKDLSGSYQIDTECWQGMPCSVRITQDVVNNRKYPHTHDWEWDQDYYQQKIKQKNQSDKKNADSVKSPLAEVAPTSTEDLFTLDVFKNGGKK